MTGVDNKFFYFGSIFFSGSGLYSATHVNTVDTSKLNCFRHVGGSQSSCENNGLAPALRHSVPVKAFTGATWHTRAVCIKQYCRCRRIICYGRRGFQLRPHANSFQIRSMKGFAVNTRFVAMKLQEMQWNLLQHPVHLVGFSVNKQTRYGDEGTDRQRDFAGALHVNSSRTWSIEHQTNGVGARFLRSEGVRY